MTSRFSVKIIAVVLAFVGILSIGGVFATWMYAEGEVSPVTTNMSVELNTFTYLKGVFITDMQATTSNTGTKVNATSNDELALTATANVTTGSGKVVYKITFYNNTANKVLFDKATSSLDVDVSNFSVATRTINPHGYMYLTAEMSASNSAKDVVFSFKSVVGTTAVITEGTSSDNINTIGDGHKNHSESVAYRWTNWENVSAGGSVGNDATMKVLFENKKAISQIDVYHFVDAGTPYPCDFPASITVQYFDGTQYQTMFVADISKSGTTINGYNSDDDVTISTNWSNARRTGTNKVYNMTIAGNTADFTSGKYKGVAPCTTFSFDEIETESMRIVFTPQANTFVGVVEIEFIPGTDVP